jgi:hypothetical protein
MPHTLGRRGRLHRLVLLPLHLGHDRSASGEHRGRARLQPRCAIGLRDARLRRHLPPRPLTRGFFSEAFVQA